MDIALIVIGVLSGLAVILVIIGLTMVVIDKVQDTRRAREDAAWQEGWREGYADAERDLAPPF